MEILQQAAVEKGKIAEQKQLPVFKAAELSGTPAEYQKKSSTYQSEVQKALQRAVGRTAPKEAPKQAQPIFRYETSDGSPVGTSPVKRQTTTVTGQTHTLFLKTSACHVLAETS